MYKQVALLVILLSFEHVQGMVTKEISTSETSGYHYIRKFTQYPGECISHISVTQKDWVYDDEKNTKDLTGEYIRYYKFYPKDAIEKACGKKLSSNKNDDVELSIEDAITFFGTIKSMTGPQPDVLLQKNDGSLKRLPYALVVHSILTNSAHDSPWLVETCKIQEPFKGSVILKNDTKHKGQFWIKATTETSSFNLYYAGDAEVDTDAECSDDEVE